MAEERQGNKQNNHTIAPSILSSIISSGSGSSSSPLSSLHATGISAQKIYLQPQIEGDDHHPDIPTPTKSSFVQQLETNRNYGCMVHVNAEYEN